MRRSLLPALALLAIASPVSAAQDSVRVRVHALSADSAPVPGAVVRASAAQARTDAGGDALLRLPAGRHRVHVVRLGFAPDSVDVLLVAGRDTVVQVVLMAQETELSGVIVSATRSERRIEDDPIRVEVLDAEEVVEKLLMTPGDITMMLNETSGLRVQVTSPSSGGATVRVQGLRGRYTQILSDGLPLYGGQTGGLGLLQIPPMDLGGVEVIKGVASALYGGTALGGVVNLQSRRPTGGSIRDVLVNRTSLGGTDGVLFVGDALSRRDGGSDQGWSYTVLAGHHLQDQTDRDADGWTDLPGFARGVVRPRLFWSSGSGRSAMLTAGSTFESRNGGTMPNGLAPNGMPYDERLQTRRFDLGGIYRGLVGSRLVNVRGSYSAQRHRHDFGAVRERDRHQTWFGEAAFTMQRGRGTWVVGAALLGERYTADGIEGFDFSHLTPGGFTQLTIDLTEQLALTGSVRQDRHNEYGAFTSPRLSVLYRLGEGWTIRTSVGSGYFAPTPFTEETEVVGLSAMRPLTGVRAERATGGSVDLGGLLGSVELNLTGFASVIRDPVGIRDARTAVPRVELVNVPEDTRVAGGELLARLHVDPLRVTLTYTLVRSTEGDPETGVRRETELTPTHQIGVVASYEREGSLRAGLELYYTGRQRVYDDLMRERTKRFLYVGALVERAAGPARVFVNAENLLNVRQTDWESLVRPVVGPGGRWTRNVWAPLDGFVVNAGVRWSLAGHKE